MSQRINIRLNAETGLGTLECVGGSTYNCGGMAYFAYPSDSTIQASDKKGTVYSQEFSNAEMPFAVLWIGQRGVYGQISHSVMDVFICSKEMLRAFIIG